MGRQADLEQTLQKTKQIVSMVIQGPESWTGTVTNYFPGREPVVSQYGVFDLAEDLGMWCAHVAPDLYRAGLVSDHVAQCLVEMGTIAEGNEGAEFDSLDGYYTHPLWKRIRELARDVADELCIDVDPNVA